MEIYSRFAWFDFLGFSLSGVALIRRTKIAFFQLFQELSTFLSKG